MIDNKNSDYAHKVCTTGYISKMVDDIANGRKTPEQAKEDAKNYLVSLNSIAYEIAENAMKNKKSAEIKGVSGFVGTVGMDYKK